jgi:DNA polymerase-3 subunit epsilon
VRDRCNVEDSLELARQGFPGQRNSLDALCRRLGVDNSHRHLHGALLDAQLLAEAYLALTSGQGEIVLAAVEDASRAAAVAEFAAAAGPRPRISATAQDLAAHDARLAQLRRKAGKAVWDALLEDEAVAGEALPA